MGGESRHNGEHMHFYKLMKELKVRGVSSQTLYDVRAWLLDPRRTVRQDIGVCGNVSSWLGDADGYFIISSFARGWENHTGDYHTPVEDYAENYAGGTLWKGAQWQLRESLMDHVANEIGAYLSIEEMYETGKSIATTQKSRVLELLNSVVKRGYGGICHQLADVSEVVHFLAGGWEHHSGDVNYPVAEEGKDPKAAYWKHAQEGTMWVGEYGKYREDLLEYMINKAEKL